MVQVAARLRMAVIFNKHALKRLDQISESVAVAKLGWIFPPLHIGRCLNFSPSDSHFLGKPKESLCENHYASVDDVKRGVQTWIKQKPAAFFERGLVSGWRKCIASTGNYVEHKIQYINGFYRTCFGCNMFLSRATIVGLRTRCF